MVKRIVGRKIVEEPSIMDRVLSGQVEGLIQDYGPLYQQGMVTLDPGIQDLETETLLNCAFGVQVGNDGRVWVCINGQSILRFKPNREDPPAV